MENISKNQREEFQVADRNSWKTIDMPPQTNTFILPLDLTEKEMEILERGFIPSTMEEKWFVYAVNNIVYFHRSWSGFCIYKVVLSGDGKHVVFVNGDKTQYKLPETHSDKEMVTLLLKHFSKERQYKQEGKR